jgi:hypothetical protein
VPGFGALGWKTTKRPAEGHNPKMSKPGIPAGSKKRIVKRKAFPELVEGRSSPAIFKLMWHSRPRLWFFNGERAVSKPANKIRNYISTVLLCRNKKIGNLR